MDGPLFKKDLLRVHKAISMTTMEHLAPPMESKGLNIKMSTIYLSTTKMSYLNLFIAHQTVGEVVYL